MLRRLHLARAVASPLVWLHGSFFILMRCGTLRDIPLCLCPGVSRRQCVGSLLVGQRIMIAVLLVRVARPVSVDRRLTVRGGHGQMLAAIRPHDHLDPDIAGGVRYQLRVTLRWFLVVCHVDSPYQVTAAIV